MVNIESIRDYMRSQAEEDRNRKWIQVEGEDLDDALRQAAIELGLSVKKLEYEIRDPGKKGSFGFGKSKCVIIAYPIVLETSDDQEEDDFDLNLSRIDEKLVDRDGEIVVRLTSAGALLSVSPPVGKGKKVLEKQAVAKLNSRNVTD
ncbi:MAG: Jag N-terminal domain-containing protein, partial [Spirochaetales bacterium]|nr:Jag N-terminal domain-containing protein [Spirochaetales bacterium]